MTRELTQEYLVRFASIFLHKIALPSFHAKLILQIFSFKNGIFKELHVIKKTKFIWASAYRFWRL